MNTETVQGLAGIVSSLAAGTYSLKLHGFSAIDRYLNVPALPYLWAETNADIAILARFIDNLRFPGIEIADGAVDTSDGTLYFRCLDNDEKKEKTNFSFSLLSFSYNCQTRRFEDPLGVYPMLRELRDKKTIIKMNKDQTSPSFWENPIDENFIPLQAIQSEGGRSRIIMDGALLLARYDLGETWIRSFSDTLIRIFGNAPGLSTEARLEPESQRAFLSCLLVSPYPDRGLNFLRQTGFLGEIWPELAALNDVDHSKEFHPEGNVWDHTMETFQHRKPGANGAYDLCLSLGLLLHDAGKPVSAAFGTRRFNGHAELGARAASRFLERLEFEPSLVNDVYYLVHNHMLPAALKQLPVKKTAEIMASPLFPILMELYRCDESSSFKSLDEFYENSAAYQTYLRNVRNPYRSADGKKIGRNEMYIRKGK